MQETGSGTIIAHAVVAGDSHDPGYLQKIRCGRHQFLGDEPVAAGGQDAGPAPFALLLAALGACTSATLRMYAERHQWNLGTVTVDLSLREDGKLKHVIRQVSISAPLDQDHLARLAEICERTPVTLALKSGVSIETGMSIAETK
jgi:putative redox protein